MAGLDPAMQPAVVLPHRLWIAGSSPAMTLLVVWLYRLFRPFSL